MINYETIKSRLSKYNVTEVNRYIEYIKSLGAIKPSDGTKVNYWFPEKINDNDLVRMYEKVAIDNLVLDGDTVTLQFKGKLMVSYNYQAYKNKVISAYPEAQFDHQLVYKGDTTSFKKESGKVHYTHVISDPFNTDRELIGTYCIIKCSKGEFLETLEMKEIKLMESKAKTQNVWREWRGEMVLKSVMKRACKRHFKDITANLDSLDNENYELEPSGLPEKIQKRINEAIDFDALNDIYLSEKDNVHSEVELITEIKKKGADLYSKLPVLEEAEYEEAIELLKSGKTKEVLRKKWNITDEVIGQLIEKAI